MSTDNQAKIIKAPAGRPERKPINRGDKLKVRNQQAGFHYRVVNISGNPSRVDDLREVGYDMANEGETFNGQIVKGSATELNLKGGDKGYLMKIPMDYYLDGELEKQRALDSQENLIHKEARESMDGFSSKGGLIKNRKPT